ncbi:hypothetical protein OPQ81_008793 [Rhizoctonia solani]|nr:hypothetical protein OPQ81_008793 [Rhizoctonia solani]
MCANSPKNENTRRDSNFCITLLIKALSYQLSFQSNKPHKLICIYLEAKGVVKSCYFFLQRKGLSLSYEWPQPALEKIFTVAIAEAINLRRVLNIILGSCVDVHSLEII